ncbi:hypothetical protein SISNIDRAFT_211538 [Sistotremastrum niveocremeum HHB9708]|uniref:Uncharacterized protein n=1 Tax=Sistotremastrum niveocremeum HHB9708 TaxID=1314777 RepID=A0A164R2K0_9AGAM|nr:hypothetical protein SISNIDRAFT_211538 [Sistotremastrum niveocremeum HHB9708]
MKEDEVGKLLEGKVAQAASKKCSFEEVSALHKEVQDWLSLEPNKPDPQHASLRLSADLLRAILLNCLAYSEATKIAKSTEVSLREQLDMYKAANERIESELKKMFHRQRSMYTAKSRECQQLRAELSRYRPQDGAGQSSSRSTSAPPRPATSLGTSPAAAPSVNVPGMSNTLVQATSRPSTAAAYGTSSTTVSFPRSAGTIGTVSPPISPARRSPSPAPDRPPPAPVPPLARLPNTPSAPVASKLPSLTRSATPGPMSGRSSTPGPFQRSASVAGHRSNSKHQIWIPSPGADDVPAVPPLPQSSSSTRSRFLSMASRPSKNN